MLTNAETAAKQGNKPFPYVLISEPGGLSMTGIGQHILVEDIESGDDGLGAVAVTSDEAGEAAKIIRGVPGATKRDAEVAVTLAGDVFRVFYGDETLVEVADIGDEALDAWELRMDAERLYDAPLKRADRLTMYDTSILTKLGQLKSGDGSKRVTLWPSHAGDTTLWRLGTLRGFIEGNRGSSDTIPGL